MDYEEAALRPRPDPSRCAVRAPVRRDASRARHRRRSRACRVEGVVVRQPRDDPRRSPPRRQAALSRATPEERLERAHESARGVSRAALPRQAVPPQIVVGHPVDADAHRRGAVAQAGRKVQINANPIGARRAWLDDGDEERRARVAERLALQSTQEARLAALQRGARAAPASRCSASSAST